MKKIISIFLIIISLFTTTIMSVINYNAKIVGGTISGDAESIGASDYFDPDTLLDRSYFDTDEEYDEYIDSFYKNSPPCDSIASTSATTTITANEVYTLTGVTPDHAIQNFHVGISYIYATMTHIDKETKISDDMYIARFKIQSDGKTAEYLDHMTFKNFGHNQILTPYNYNNKTYFWIGCKPHPVTEEEMNNDKIKGLTTQFGRVQYEANKTYTSYTQICRFGNLNYANKSCTNRGEVLRNDGALSSNKEYFMLSVRCKRSDGTITIDYSCYDNTALNKALDKVEADPSTNLVVFKDNTTLKNACSYTIEDNQGSLPSGGSCQGIELTDAFSLYISGGTGKKNHGPEIKKFIKSGNVYVDKKTVKVKLPTSKPEWGETEIEGMQIYHDYLYFVLGKPGNSGKTTQYIYSIEKSELS